LFYQVVFACGTGTTAYFANRHFEKLKGDDFDIEVLAVPCVGSSDYLQNQMSVLDRECNPTSSDFVSFPKIVWPKFSPQRVFAKPYKEHYHIWQRLTKQTGIAFDLIYAPRVFEILFTEADQRENSQKSLRDLYPGCNIIYYHCGGVEGNDSQLERYRKKGIIL
jgi:1-aminocyclopropane-1-carboxylate deaminase